ncbi:MAG: DsbE family thiol:disulfide interchange protein [Pseudomonadota bacterium]
MFRAVLPVVIFIILAGFLYAGLFKDPSLVPSPLIGKSIPVFNSSTLNDPNKQVSNSDLLGEFALINVWATWCVACKQEHAALVYLANQKQMPIYGLNYKDDRAAAIEWLQQYGDPYVFSVFDENGRIGFDFGVYGAPETFLIDKQGIIRHKLVGIMTPEIWENEFVPIISGVTMGSSQ